MGTENDLLKKLLSTFKLEAEERLKTLSSSLLRLEESPPDEERNTIVESIYREAHSLKGAARAVGLTDIEAVCQSLESVISALKRGTIAPSPEMYDTFYRVIDAVGAALPAKEGEDIVLGRDKVAKLEQDLDALIAPRRGEPRPGEELPPAQVKTAETSGEEAETAAPEAGERKGDQFLAPALSETVRISTGKLESLMLQVEELLTLKIAAGQRTAEFREVQSALSSLKKKLARDLQDVEKDIGVGPVLEALGETREYIGSLEKKLGDLARSSDLDRRTAAGMVDGLLDDVKKVLMLPFSSLLEVFPRMVRDLSRDQGKEVELVIKGDEVEIDRRILEEMKNPLIHLVRNCVDHGIEMPEGREQAGKPRAGTISLEVSQIEGDKVRIAVIDDGAGIDTEKMKVSAVRAGIINSEEAGRLSESESLSLMFRSDLSTSAIVTEVSGRGLGLAIVHETVERLGGNIAVETDPNGGTRFELVVPITITTFRGILVRAADQDFIIPTTSIERVVRIKRDYVRTVENTETISLDGQTVPLVRLAGILELPTAGPEAGEDGNISALVINALDRRVAFYVDEVAGEQEVLVKGLGKQLVRVRNVAGATVLGSGQVVPVLNASDFVKSVVRAPRAKARTPSEPKKEKTERKILVVEDSITARSLLKNILEGAGYEVTTAVDGIDALTELKSRSFDLVVTDIEMPRMDGFELTERIRTDEKLSEMPVVVVTGLESREERERGIDAGADAYIVKSSFDQSNLLEVIKRLI